MGRHGMRSFGAVILVALSLLLLLNQYDAFDWLISSSSSASSLSMAAGSKSSSSYGIEDLHGAEMRRRLLQLTPVPAPAPAPSSAGSGIFIGYGVLTAGYCPCPPQSGRSYYTADCQSAEGPANPYTRGCSVITDCARS